MEPYGASRAMWNPLLERVAPACFRTRLSVLALATLCLLQRQDRGRETVGSAFISKSTSCFWGAWRGSGYTDWLTSHLGNSVT